VRGPPNLNCREKERENLFAKSQTITITMYVPKVNLLNPLHCLSYNHTNGKKKNGKGKDTTKVLRGRKVLIREG